MLRSWSSPATGLGFIAFSRRMIADPRWRDLAAYTMLTGIAILFLFVAVGFFAIDDGAPLHAWAGLLQRVLRAVWFTCLIVLCVFVAADLKMFRSRELTPR